MTSVRISLPLLTQHRGSRAGLIGRWTTSTAPDRQRMVFILREVEGLSTDEICKILEATFTNLDVILNRMRNRRRECLPKGSNSLAHRHRAAAMASGER